jgi:hypothetical protein
MTNATQSNNPAEDPAPLPTSTAEFDRDIQVAAGCLSESLSLAPAVLAALEWLRNREGSGGSGADEAAK